MFFPFLVSTRPCANSQQASTCPECVLGLLTASQTSFQSGTGGIAKPRQKEQQGRRKKLQGMEMVLLMWWKLVQPGGFGVQEYSAGNILASSTEEGFFGLDQASSKDQDGI